MSADDARGSDPRLLALDTGGTMTDTFYEDWLGVAPPDRRDGDLVGDGPRDGAGSDADGSAD